MSSIIVSPAELIDEATVDELRTVFEEPSDDAIGKFADEIRIRLGWSHAPARNEVRYQLLRFLIDDDRSRLHVQSLQDRSLAFDRDQKSVDLWRILAREHGDFVKESHLSIVYHQRRLFAWLIDRYDLPRARAIFAPAQWLHSWIAFLPLLGVLAAIAFIDTPGIAMLIVFTGYFVPVATWKLCGLPAFEFLQSLIPRLAGTAAAGSALMLSSADLVLFLRNHMSGARSFILMIPATFYLALEIQQRVHPRLRFRELVNRLFGVVFLALAHAASVVFLILPVIQHLLKRAGATETVNAAGLFAFTTAVFAAGLVLNVIWAEEPITRPL